MQQAFRFLWLFLVTFSLWSFQLSAAVDRHISPLEDDSNPGTSALPITPPFAADIGPGGTATHGIDFPNNTLTGVATGNQVSSNSIEIPVKAKFIQNLASVTAQKIVLYGTSLTANGAWVSQLQASVQASYPNLATWVNSGGSGKASDWGLANLKSKVIDHNPDAVFIEFSMNDAATTLGISRTQAVANLDAMVDAIIAARPNCEIILQIMNPRDFQPGDSFDPRLELELYQQDCRDYANANGLQFIDHMPAWRALLDKGTAAYRVHVPDGTHPNANAYSLFMTPVLLHAIGLQATALPGSPDIIIDNSDGAPAFATTGTWTTSTFAEAAPNTPYNGNSLHDGDTAKGTKTAVFTPTIPSTGSYPVFLRWVSSTNRASNVPVTVTLSGGSQTLTIDQRQSGGTWYKLGDFAFAAGTSGNVSIATTGTSGFVNVDALEFLPQPPSLQKFACACTTVASPSRALPMVKAAAAPPPPGSPSPPPRRSPSSSTPAAAPPPLAPTIWHFPPTSSSLPGNPLPPSISSRSTMAKPSPRKVFISKFCHMPVIS